LTSDDTVVPGQEFSLTVSVVNGGPLSFAGMRSVTDLPMGWTITPDGAATGSLAAGQRLDQKYKIKASSATDFTQPYWLRQPAAATASFGPMCRPVRCPWIRRCCRPASNWITKAQPLW